MQNKEIEVGLALYPFPAPGVVGSRVAGEAVIVLTDQAKVKVLNEVGARIWELADGSLNVEEIAAQITREYQVEENEARSDAQAFIGELTALGVLQLSEKPLTHQGDDSTGKGE